MYKKSVIWYISREMRPLAKKMEAYINRKGKPKVKLKVKGKHILVVAPLYAKFQDKGVQGAESKGKAPRSPYKYGKNGIPPLHVFERYTTDPQHQYNIARKIFREGYKPQKYIRSSFGYFAPQMAKAIQRGTKKYISEEIVNNI